MTPADGQSVCAATYIKHAIACKTRLIAVHCPMQSDNNDLQHIAVNQVSRPFVYVVFCHERSATYCCKSGQSAFRLCCLLSSRPATHSVHLVSRPFVCVVFFHQDLQHISVDLVSRAFVCVVFFQQRPATYFCRSGQSVPCLCCLLSVATCNKFL